MSDLKYTHVFAVPGQAHIIDPAVLVDGETTYRGAYSGETIDQIVVRYPGTRLYDFDDWQREAGERQRSPITWTTTTQKQYRDMLEVLPPAMWTGGAFLVGEPMDHDIATGRPRFEAYWHRNGTYLHASRPLTCAELRAELAVISAEAAQ